MATSSRIASRIAGVKSPAASSSSPLHRSMNGASSSGPGRRTRRRILGCAASQRNPTRPDDPFARGARGRAPHRRARRARGSLRARRSWPHRYCALHARRPRDPHRARRHSLDLAGPARSATASAPRKPRERRSIEAREGNPQSAEVVDEYAQRLVAKIEAALLYHRGRHPGFSPNRILLTGEGRGSLGFPRRSRGGSPSRPKPTINGIASRSPSTSSGARSPMISRRSAWRSAPRSTWRRRRPRPSP